jgi:hypothetical protein
MAWPLRVEEEAKARTSRKKWQADLTHLVEPDKGSSDSSSLTVLLAVVLLRNSDMPLLTCVSPL